MVSINSFGVGGTNVHVILRAHNKTAQTVPLPKIEIPRLLFLSGRTREALNEQFEIVSFHNYITSEINIYHNIHTYYF